MNAITGQCSELFQLYMIARADCEHVLPTPLFGEMLGYTQAELRELYQSAIDKADRGNAA